MIQHKLSHKVQNDEIYQQRTYINREIIIKLNIKKKNNKGDQRKCGSIYKNSVINIKNRIILLNKNINNCTLSNQLFFFFFGPFENDSTKHRSTQSINQFKFQGQTKKSTNLTKICQTKSKINQYNNQTKQNSRN